VHRVEEYLPRCLDSLLDGTGREVEVVAVEDRSPDRSGEVLDRYAARDPRVRVVHLAMNVGLGRARNAGLELTRGGYVWFVDSDDWLPEGSVPAVVDRLAATRPDVLMVDHVEVYPDGRTLAGAPPGALAGTGVPGPLARRPELLALPHSACTKVVRRRFLDEIDLRFPPGWYEDSGYSHRLLLAAPCIDTLDRIAYCYRRRGDGAITGSVSDRHFDVFRQYGSLWDTVDAAGGAYERFRPELFRLMVDHLLVIAGNHRRLPRARRREFFDRIVQEYRHRLPEGGYERPGGLAGLKHRLVHRDAYRAYAALRLGWRAVERLRGVVSPVPAADRVSEPQPASLMAR
jgi:CDP-glycerol glycerophosphotransferase